MIPRRLLLAFRMPFAGLDGGRLRSWRAPRGDILNWCFLQDIVNVASMAVGSLFRYLFICSAEEGCDFQQPAHG